MNSEVPEGPFPEPDPYRELREILTQIGRANLEPDRWPPLWKALESVRRKARIREAAVKVGDASKPTSGVNKSLRVGRNGVSKVLAALNNDGARIRLTRHYRAEPSMGADGGVELDQLRAALVNLEKAFLGALGEAPTSEDLGSSINWMMLELGRVAEDWLDIPARTQNDFDEAEGPFVDFACAVLESWNRPTSPGAIATALKRGKAAAGSEQPRSK